MSATGTQARSRARRRSRFSWIVALTLVVALVGSAAVGGWLALGAAQDKGMLGGAIVVPEDLRPVIRKAAKRCDAVPLEVFAAQIAAESGWDPDAVSPAGARGIAQFMPATWDQYGIDANDDGALCCL